MMTAVTRALRTPAPTTLHRLAATPSFHTLRTPLHPRPLIARYRNDDAPDTPQTNPQPTAAKHTASDAAQPPATQQEQQRAPTTRRSDDAASLTSPFLGGPPSLHRLSRYMADMQREMDDVMRALLPAPPPSMLSPFALMAPPTDLFSPLLAPLTAFPTPAMTPLHVEETESSYIVMADVPGMSKDDVKVSLTPDHELVVRGEKQEESESKGGEGAFRERRYRNFVRRLRLPEWVEPEGIQARTKDGVLTITIPKSESHKQEQVKEIPVSAE